MIDADMVYEGYEEYLPEALRLKSAYDYEVSKIKKKSKIETRIKQVLMSMQLLGILSQYGVTERDALGGCVAGFKGEFGKRAEQQTALALNIQVTALKQKYPIIYDNSKIIRI